MKTKSTPFGGVELPVNPITSAIINGATFVARGFSGSAHHLTDLMKQAIQHKGFSLNDIFSPCVTFNHDNTYPFFGERIKLLDDESHDTTDWNAACEKAMQWDDTIYVGLFFEKQEPTLQELEPVLDEGGSLAFRPLGLSQQQSQRLIEQMM